MGSSPSDSDGLLAGGSRSRLWLATWLWRRPDIPARLIQVRKRLRDLSVARRNRLVRAAGATLAGVALLLAMGGGGWGPPEVSAAAITVESGIVAVANDGKCSLVEAIINANSDNRVFTGAGECIAGSGADTITLPGSTFSLLSAYGGFAYYSDNGLPPITSDITIQGGGATIERAAASRFRVLLVDDSGDLTLNNTTISGGSTDAWGGGIYVSPGGQATLTGSIILGNQAYSGGGIATKLGTVTLTNSVVSGNTAANQGGGIFSNLGNVTLTDSTVSANEAGGRGGGIAVAHGNVIALTASTVRGNTAGNGGGAVYLLGGTVTLTNTTITDNTATAGDGGGILNRGGSTTITNSTITANSAAAGGGGLHEEHQLAQVTLIRSLIAGNSAIDGDEVHRSADAGPITVDDYNVFGHAGLTGAQAFVSFSPGTTDFSATSDEENVPLGSILDFLDNNGGPTFTHALVPGSPAIDFAPSSECDGGLDQRGFGRNADGDNQPSAFECDTGAFEFAAALPTATTSPQPTNTPTVTSTSTASPTPTTTGTPPTPTATPSGTPPSPTPTLSPTATQPSTTQWRLFTPMITGNPP